MRKLVLFLLFVLVVSMAAYGQQVIVTFDDLPGDNQLVPQGYGGIDWNNNWTYYGAPQDPYNPHSPPNRVYTFDPLGAFSFQAPVVFDGAWFSGNDFATVTFNLYLGGNLVWTSATLDPSSTPTFLASGYDGLVDTVHVVSPSPDFYVMDDVTYHSGSGGTVPEPSSFALLGSGVLAMGAAVRRKLGR